MNNEWGENRKIILKQVKTNIQIIIIFLNRLEGESKARSFKGLV